MKGDTWFKFYVKAIWSPSLRKLTPTQRWVWNTLLALATEGDGVIHGAATEPSHIALASATDARGVPDALAKMQHLCLINVHKNGDIKIRNWPKYQSTTAERRKRKVRQIGGEKPAEKRQVAAPDKKLEVDKKEEVDNIKHILDYWTSLPNLLQPRKITAEDKKAVEFRLNAGAPVDEIKRVLMAYNNTIGNPKTFWGGNNDRGAPIRFNIRRVMKGKLTDKLTYVYEHFLEQIGGLKSKPPEPGWQHKCPKAQAVRAGGHDCKKYEAWLVNPKKSSYPCNDCEEAK